MAALTATQIGDRIPIGNEFEYTYSVPVANAAAADEWFVTRFSKILSATTQVLGTTDRGVNVVLNASGTGVAADTNAGNLGIEATGAATVIVRVRGRL